MQAPKPTAPHTMLRTFAAGLVLASLASTVQAQVLTFWSVKGKSKLGQEGEEVCNKNVLPSWIGVV